MNSRKIDHLVYAVLDLEFEMDRIGRQLGIHPVFGGYHRTQGTKNALLNLGDGCYLEILAKDDSNTTISEPRWMGIDLIKKARITRWALKSNDIEKDSNILSSHYPNMGTTYQGSRLTTTGETLAWKMILPLSTPEIELIPFMVDWSQSSFHPTEKLQRGCSLKSITFASNDADKKKEYFDELGIQYRITKSTAVTITAIIEGPKGSILLK